MWRISFRMGFHFKSCIFGIVVLCLVGPIRTMENFLLEEDFSYAETLLLHYHDRELKWKWSIKPFCRAICPGEFGVNDEYTYIEKRQIMLEAPDCTKIDAELLTCGCETRKPGEDVVHMFTWHSLVSGLNGEIYEMQSPIGRTQCDDEKTYTIFKAIVRGEYIFAQPPCLWGVKHVFEEVVQKGFNILFQAGMKRTRSQIEKERKRN